MADTIDDIGVVFDGATTEVIHATEFNSRDHAPLTNKSGGALVTGDVGVLLTSTTGSAYETTTTKGDVRKVVVVGQNITGNNVPSARSIASDELAWVQEYGYCPAAHIDAAATMYDYLVTSTTAKKLTTSGINASSTNEPPKGACAILLATAGAASDQPIYLLPNTEQKPRNNFAAVTDPGVNNDNSSGQSYSVGSLWLNTVTRTLFVANSVGAGAAAWVYATPMNLSGYVQVVSTVTETNLFLQSIPENALSTKGTYEGEIQGYIITSDGTAGNRNVTFKVYYGATSFTLATGNLANSASPQLFTLKFRITSKNSATAQIIWAEVRVGTATASGSTGALDVVAVGGVNNTSAENSATALNARVSVTLAVASATVECTSLGGRMSGALLAA